MLEKSRQLIALYHITKLTRKRAVISRNCMSLSPCIFTKYPDKVRLQKIWQNNVWYDGGCYAELETQWMVRSLDRAIPEIESYLLLRNLFADDAQKVIQKTFNELILATNFTLTSSSTTNFLYKRKLYYTQVVQNISKHLFIALEIV
ncbi:hypothetical protein WN51_01823 [Melipona quadrifasciata]|uniref:Uncharacterized protein n=1 Tax=Melipona quadrifasciata TaxID=166423 RepID=A0A0M8ZWL8_9HYME|nr:hypothetical protein WN51_01823 [Melipona quadrifasciata]